MAAPIISISLDSSEESVGSHAPRVILFGTIPAIISVILEVPIAPADLILASEVGEVSVISPTRVLDLVDYSSSSNSDPLEDSLPVAPELPLVSPLLCTDESEAIPFGRPYRTHPNRPRKLLTARKRVGPFPAHRLAWRRVSHRSSDRHSSSNFTSDSSYSSSSSVYSSDISSGSSSDSLSDSSSVHSSGQSHSRPSTRVASPRFIDPPVRTPRCNEAFMCWRSAPLSTFYPPTTLESSPDSSSERSLDSSSPSTGPSRKRCRSPTTLVLSSTPVPRSIAPAIIDLSPCKRFRDSYSSEVSGEEHMEIGTTNAETVADLGYSEGRHDEVTVILGLTGDISEPTGGDAPDLEVTLYDMSLYMAEVPLDRITKFKTAQRQLEVGQLEASRERARLADRVKSLGRENLRVRALLCIEIDRVDSLRRHMALSQEEFRQVRRDCDNTRRRLRRTMTITRSGMTPEAIEELVNRRVEEALAAYEATRVANVIEAESQSQNDSDGDNGNGGNGNPKENDRCVRPVARECTYQDFMKCQPLNFKGTERVVGLIRWFKKMETIFHISNCLEQYQVKYATCILLNSALTWWNSHKRTIGTDADAAFAMSWRELMKLMAEVYYPRTEIQKMV
ncbi:hypothetical protein Tco_1516082 [Tanacetum coccineum]